MKHILIADDEAHIVRLMALTLERAGYRVSSVRNGEEALAEINREAPDLLIVDIQMPRMTGEELCKRLHAKLPEREFMIIVSTSRTEREHREWSRQIPNLIFIEKPVSTRKLVATLDAHFAKLETADVVH